MDVEFPSSDHEHGKVVVSTRSVCDKHWSSTTENVVLQWLWVLLEIPVHRDISVSLANECEHVCVLQLAGRWSSWWDHQTMRMRWACALITPARGRLAFVKTRRLSRKRRLNGGLMGDLLELGFTGHHLSGCPAARQATNRILRQ